MARLIALALWRPTWEIMGGCLISIVVCLVVYHLTCGED
jgi:hypothetical protein